MNRLIPILGFVAFTVLCFFCIRLKAPDIEIDVLSRTSQTLMEAGFSWVDLQIDGRDLILMGTATDEGGREQAERLVRDVWGVRTVANQITILASADEHERADETEDCRAGIDDWLSNQDNISFTSGGISFNALYEPMLDSLALKVLDCPDAHLLVEGHGDSQGSDAVNLRLSLERAERVVFYLISKGMGDNQVTAEGFGESHPIADNNTSEGRARNRRVAFSISQ